MKRNNDKKSTQKEIIMKKKIVAIITCAVMATGLAACGNSVNSETNETTETAATETAKTEAGASETAAETSETEGSSETKDLSGTISMAGSTSMEKLANSVAEAFMNKYPNVTVTAEFTGSSAGIESLEAGSVDIGNASRELEDAEKTAGCVENIVAIDGIAVITDKDNTAANLTKEQLVSIYKGEITNWKDAGGPDEAIVVVGREAGSGTRGAFEELLDVKDACKYANELDSTGAVMAKVAATPGAIGYVSLDIVDDSVKALSLDGTEASEENIKAGSYILSRPFVMATMGDISAQSEPVKALFDYLGSDEGKTVIKNAGLITVD